jgi:superfamily II DNA helicase RecQ
MTGKDEAMMVHAESFYDEGERLVIFAALQPEQERIYKLLKEKGYRVGLINGNVSEKDRVRIDEEFREHKLDFVVGSAATMGVGFNWNFLKMVLFVSLDYGDDTFSQAYKRGIRGHRDQALLVKVLMYENSIDYRIFQIVQRKSEDNHQVDETKDIIFLTNEAMAAKKVKQVTGSLPMKEGKFSMK